MLIQQLRRSRPFGLVAGLNAIQDYPELRDTAEKLLSIAREANLEFVFKASFDKANRSNEGAYRGPGITKGLEHLARLKSEVKGLQVVTDVHETSQCERVREAGLDMIQIPAFLCRQTDLLHAAADTGLPLLLKKGQFASANVMKAAVEKAESRLNYAGCILCERGTSVGSDLLMMDARNLVLMRGTSGLVGLDCTHAAQHPAARVSEGKGSDGDLFAVKAFARTGVAVGIDCLFIEVHPDPSKAPVDQKLQYPLAKFQGFLSELIAIGNASQWRSQD